MVLAFSRSALGPHSIQTRGLKDLLSTLRTIFPLLGNLGSLFLSCTSPSSGFIANITSSESSWLPKLKDTFPSFCSALSFFQVPLFLSFPAFIMNPKYIFFASIHLFNIHLPRHTHTHTHTSPRGLESQMVFSPADSQCLAQNSNSLKIYWMKEWIILLFLRSSFLLHHKAHFFSFSEKLINGIGSL